MEVEEVQALKGDRNWSINSIILDIKAFVALFLFVRRL